MAKSPIGKLFERDGDQAVRLPVEFRLPGKEVRVRRLGAGLLLEPIWDAEAMKAFWAKIDALSEGAFLPEGCPEQPPMPIDDRKYFDE